MKANITRKDAAEYQHDYIYDFIETELEDKDVIDIYNAMNPDHIIYKNTQENLFSAYHVNNVMDLLDYMLQGIGKEVTYDASDEYFYIDDYDRSGAAVSFDERYAKDVLQNDYYALDYGLDDVVTYACDHFDQYFDGDKLYELFLQYVNDVDPDLDVDIRDIVAVLENNDLIKDDWYDLLMKVYAA